MKKESIFNTFICFFIVYLDVVIGVICKITNHKTVTGGIIWTVLLAIVAVLYLICISNESLIYHVVTFVISFIFLILSTISLSLEHWDFEHISSKLKLIYHLSEMLLFIPVYYLQIKKIIKFYKNEI